MFGITLQSDTTKSEMSLGYVHPLYIISLAYK